MIFDNKYKTNKDKKGSDIKTKTNTERKRDIQTGTQWNLMKQVLHFQSFGAKKVFHKQAKQQRDEPHREPRDITNDIFKKFSCVYITNYPNIGASPAFTTDIFERRTVATIL